MKILKDIYVIEIVVLDRLVMNRGNLTTDGLELYKQRTCILSTTVV